MLAGHRERISKNQLRIPPRMSHSYYRQKLYRAKARIGREKRLDLKKIHLAPFVKGVDSERYFADYNYCSSSEYSSNASNAWNVNPSNGNTNNNDKSNGNYARCVRRKSVFDIYNLLLRGLWVVAIPSHISPFVGYRRSFVYGTGLLRYRSQ